MLLILVSFFIVAFGQPAWISGAGSLAAGFGYAFFWKGMLQFGKKKDRFLLAMGWFTAVQAIQLSWMTTTEYMGPLILFVYLFLILAMGAQFGLLSLLLGGTLSWIKILAMSGLWVFFEWIRLFFLCGFTWNMVGLSLATSLYSLQFASVFGIFGLSFWVILVNLTALQKKRWIWASLALFPYFFGVVSLYWHGSKGALQQIEVALIQTHLMPEEKDFYPNRPTFYREPEVQWEEIVNALDRANLTQVDLIVFPEAAFPFGAHVARYSLDWMAKHFSSEVLAPCQAPCATSYQGRWKVSNAFLLQTLANQYGADVISGLDDRDRSGKYNAAFYFRPQNSPYERYEKRVLVPVGEYIPLQGWESLSRFIGERFGIFSSFDPGKEAKVFQGRVPIGISICLEETFTELIRDLRMKGAQLVVNVTNDAWFPGSKLASQHLEHGRIRAVENGVPILRSCNAGISCGIDSFGRVIEKTESEDLAVLRFTLPLYCYKTLYSFWGDGGILSISLSSLLAYFFFEKKKLL